MRGILNGFYRAVDTRVCTRCQKPIREGERYMSAAVRPGMVWVQQMICQRCVARAVFPEVTSFK